MRLQRWGRAGLPVAIGVVALALTGCRFTGEVAARCVSEPPRLGGPGQVSYDIEVPPSVAAGQPFTIRVDELWGADDVVPTPSDPHRGTVSVTGAVTAPGLRGVSSGSAGGTGYPAHLGFTALATPGATISVDVVRGGWYRSDFSYLAECIPIDGSGQSTVVHVATITVR